MADQDGAGDEADLPASGLREDGKRDELAEGVALGAIRPGESSSEERVEAVRYLRMQSEMLRLQMEHLHEQRGLQTSSLRLRRYAERLKIAFQLLSIGVGVLLAIVVIWCAWDASRDRSLVIQPFATPANFPDRGLTGAVVATELLDRLAAMNASTDSARAPDSYQDSWSRDIKVEIPQTGVSIGELLRILRDWLGHQTRITGEVVRTPAGLAVTARTGDQPGESVEGSEAELGALLERTAESVFRRSQPYRYGVYLFAHGRREEAVAAFSQLAEARSASERPWALVGWGGALGSAGRRVEGRELVLQALRLDPGLAAGWNVLADLEDGLGHDGGAHAARLKLIESLTHGHGRLTPRAERQTRLNTLAKLSEDAGDFRRAAAYLVEASEAGDYQAVRATLRARLAIDRLRAHLPADEAAIDSLPADEFDRPFYAAQFTLAQAWRDGGWTAAAPRLAALVDEASAGPQAAYRRQITIAWLKPWLAYALQRSGRGSEADLILARTPADSTPGLRVRGLVAADRSEVDAARRWFLAAAEAAPRAPWPHADLGDLLLKSGDLPGAEAAFRRAMALAQRWPEARSGLCKVELRRGRRDEAQRCLSAAADLAQQGAAARSPA